MRMHHDMGGLPAGPVERSEHEYEPWEKLVDAVFILLSTRHPNLLRVDELRRNIEALAPDVYDRLTYYERWAASMTHAMIQRGVITSEELARKMQEIEQRLQSQVQP
jgi:Nitrile hydratase beta subunit